MPARSRLVMRLNRSLFTSMALVGTRLAHGSVEDEDRPQVRLDASARRADPANASGANLAVHDMAVLRQKIEGAAKDVAPLSAQAVRCLPCARAGTLLRG